MCLVVFQKIFRKIFSGVWKMLQGKNKPISTLDKTQINARDRLGLTARCFASSSPTTAPSIVISRSTAPLREIAIDGAISRSVDRDLAKHRSARRWVLDLGSRSTALVLANGADWSLDVRTAPTGSLSPFRALALSLSLWNSFEVKIGTEIHFRSQSLFFWVNGNQFPKNSIFRTNQTPAFSVKHFQKLFSPKTNTALYKYTTVLRTTKLIVLFTFSLFKKLLLFFNIFCF